jgi:general secretion pathway protein L
MTIDTLALPAHGISRLLRRGIAWWLGELVQMMPRPLLGIFGGRQGSGALVRIGPDEGLLWPSPAALERLTRAGRRGGSVTLELDRALVFESVLELPAVAQGSLRPIIEHQIERLVPLEARETRFEYHLDTRAGEAQTIAVRVFIAKRTTIERALAAARDAGLDPRRVVVADWAGEGGAPVLWRADAAVDRHRALCRRLEIAALVLAACGYALYLHRLDGIEDGLEARLAAATPVAAAVRSLGGEAGRVEAAADFFSHRRAETPPLAVVDALTKLVPLDSWLTRLAIHGREVEIAGFSPDAGDLVRRVERSPIFEKPQFGSPITLAPDGRTERFDLDFEVRAEMRR